MSERLTCPDCGAPLPAGSPRDLCPRCLMRAGLRSDTGSDEALLAAHDGAGRFLEGDPAGMSEPTSPETLEATRASVAGNASPVGTGDRGTQTGRHDLHDRGRPAGRPPRRIRRGPGHRRPVHAARSPRRGGDGHRLPGRADRAGQAAGGAQADQDRHGLAGRAGPVRRRAAGAGPDGPPQHRPRLRRRHHRGRSAVLRDGAGRAACRSPSTATGSGFRSGPGWSCSSPSARPCNTPTRRGSSTAT